MTALISLVITGVLVAGAPTDLLAEPVTEGVPRHPEIEASVGGIAPTTCIDNRQCGGQRRPGAR